MCGLCLIPCEVTAGLPPPHLRSKAYLEIDNRQCSQNSKHCFSNTELAASYIAAEYLKKELPYPVISVNSKRPRAASARASGQVVLLLNS